VSRQNILTTGAADAPFLQPPPGKRFVRSFLFSRRIDAPLAQVHLLARIVLVFSLSAALLRAINTDHPDLLGAIVLWFPGILLFACSGIRPRVARIYVLLTIPTLFSLFFTWAVFNPVPGTVLLRQPVYGGTLHIGVALWEIIWLALVVAYFLWRRGLLVGILLASLVTFVLTRFVALPAWTFAQVAFFHPLTVLITDQGALLSLIKMIGYSSMILCTVALVMTSSDIELIGLLRQLRTPQPVVFFLSTVFRALNLAFTDYETIYQAQIARAINARPRSLVRRLRDLGSIAVPMVAMMIRRSSEIGDAFLARGYSLRNKSADFYETSPLRSIDWIMFGISLCLLYFAFGPHPTLTILLQRGI